MNPFIGVPVGDYLRDAAAAICLFAALGKPWDNDGDGADHWWVVLALLVSVASLAIPYLTQSRLVPGLRRDQAQILKLAANAPTLVAVLAALVNELVHATDLDAPGAGAAVALAMAGAFLALQPRAHDEDLGRRDDRTWYAAVSTASVVAALVAIATFVAFILRDLTGDFRFFTDDPVLVMSLLASPLFVTLALLGWSSQRVVNRHLDGVVVVATVGFTFVAIALLTQDSFEGLFNAYAGITFVGADRVPVEHWDSLTGGVFAVAAAGALAVSRPALRVARGPHPVVDWLATARLALGLAAAGSAFAAISYLLGMVAGENYPGAFVAATILLAAHSVTALVGAMLVSGQTLNRLVVVATTSLIPVLGIAAVAVIRSSEEGALIGTFALDGLSTSALFTLPLLAIVVITAPKPVRDLYGPLLPDREPWPGGQPGSPAPPGPPPGWTPPPPPSA